MTAADNLSIVRSANDDLDAHYAEKIWSLIPEVYRFEDGLADDPGQLRALVEVLAEQAAVARRSIDRLWADTRILDADDWAVPYIGALVGARPVQEQNRAARRSAGSEIGYRRRSGTALLMERLADDIADWDAVVREGFKRLHRHWHRLDCPPEIGQVTCTPEGGFADIRATRVDEVLDEAFDDLAHTADFRRLRGTKGRYGVPKVNLHLFRQRALELNGVTPFDLGGGHFTLDPSGRDVPLFQVGGIDLKDGLSTEEWHVRAPITCRGLQAGGFMITRADAPPGLATELRSVYGREFKNEADMLAAADAALAGVPGAPNFLSDVQAQLLVAAGLLSDTPRAKLLPGGDGAAESINLSIASEANSDPLGPDSLYSANLAEWGATHSYPGWISAVVDPELGRFRAVNPIPADRDLFIQKLFYGIFDPVGAGTHERIASVSDEPFTAIASTSPDLSGPLTGELRFMDSATYEPTVTADEIVVTGSLTLSAANGERPLVRFSLASGNSLTIRNDETVEDGILTIDGLWLGAAANGDAVTELVIVGPWRKVILRDSTIDPGGLQAAPPTGPAATLPEVRIVLQGPIDEVLIDRCITGGVEERVDGVDTCSADSVTMCDSVVGTPAAEIAVRVRNASLCVTDSTFFGDIIAGQLDASGVIVDGAAFAENEQQGCFRFSAAAADSRVAHPYRSVFFEGGLPATTFVSQRFGDPGYAQLREAAPVEVREQNENGTEMGVFRRALDPIKRRDLEAKLAEYAPVSIVVQMIYET